MQRLVVDEGVRGRPAWAAWASCPTDVGVTLQGFAASLQKNP
jgi:hypothetical protein